MRRVADWLWLPFVCVNVACAASAAGEQKAIRHETSAAELQRAGEFSAASGDLTRAEQYFVSALRAGGDERAIVKSLLVVCVADQRYPAALEYAERYLRRHPLDTEVEFAQASLLAAMGQTVQARAVLEDVVQRRPEWPDAHYVLASVLRQTGADADLADVQDLEYLKLEPKGQLAESARYRLRRVRP
jgi:predicted Zn-dependent protease